MTNNNDKEEIRVWKSRNITGFYLLVYRNRETEALRITYPDGREYPYHVGLIGSHRNHRGGLWGVCRTMGDDIDTIRQNILTEQADDKARLEQIEHQMQNEIQEKERALQQAQEIRAALAGTKDTLTIPPIDVLQRYDTLEEYLEQLKPGDYAVCINYKKKGMVELRTKARPTDHLKVTAKVTKEEKNTRASLHRLAVKVREAYQSGIFIIGKTHALKGFGKCIVDAAPCIKESQNSYYSSSAPRQYYDKNTLIYMKLEYIEKGK